MAAKLRRSAALAALICGHTFALQTPRLFARPSPSHNCRQPPHRGIRATENDGLVNEDTDADLEDFLDGLDEKLDNLPEEATSKNITIAKTESLHFIQRQQAVGIGGSSGLTFDVNALKRNLVQESVRGCKQELLTLLGDGREYSNAKDTKGQRPISIPRSRRERDELIEERLASLVQANPVSTTTDSNLLDGDWSFAFATKSASGILDTTRFLLSRTKRKESTSNKQTSSTNNGDVTTRGGPWRFKSGKTENPFRSSTRQIFLENLSEHEDAHIVDETSVLGGLYTIKQRYGVFGLTRTALDLDLVEKESRLLGIPIRRKNSDDFRGTKYGAPLEVQVLYLDTDLCVCTTGLGFDGPLHVYTKSDLWVTGGAKRKLRLLTKTGSWIATLESPFHIRQKLSKLFTPKKSISKPPDSVLKAINIGELGINADGTTKEDPSWDGEDDPFYHLTPKERMEVLKTMSLQDIYQAGLKKKTQNKKEKSRWSSRGKQFKRPDL